MAPGTFHSAHVYVINGAVGEFRLDSGLTVGIMTTGGTQRFDLSDTSGTATFLVPDFEDESNCCTYFWYSFLPDKKTSNYRQEAP